MFGRRLLVVAMVAGLGGAAGARPSVSGVSTSVDADARVVTVGYALAEAPAVVTVALQTNATEGAAWLPVDDALVTRMAGDVNRVVRDDGAHTVWIRPDATLGCLEAARLRAVVTAWATNAPPDYMVVDLAGGAELVRYFSSAAALPDGGLAHGDYRETRLVMRRIPAARQAFRMGSSVGEWGRGNNEIPHLVTFTEDYYLSIYPVTSEQYHFVNNSETSLGQQPIGDLSYNMLRGASKNWPTTGHDVEDDSIVGKFRAVTGIDFDLPTEAQWEFACRAGCEHARYDGAEADVDTDKIGHYGQDVNTGTRIPVGLKLPNAWGLYDMLGNSWELCLDWYSAGADYSDGSPATDPVGPASGTERVARGGAYNSNANQLRSALRASAEPGRVLNRYTLRLCCPAVAR